MHAPPSDFLERAESMGIAFEQDDVDRLSHYLDLLLDANTRFNLTAITDPAEAWTRHILDSLTLVPLIASVRPEAGQTAIVGQASVRAVPIQVIDIGSGGGLPGIPLAIVLRKVQFTLLEATGKKARFLQETAAALQLRNVRVINDRAEILGQDHQHHREQYDIVLARAVGRMPTLLELTIPFAKMGGLVLAMKGAQAESEIAEAKQTLHMLHAHVVDRRVTDTGVIVVIEKQRKTPRAYPRKPGEAKRAPLGIS
jgi:16S rRNA (guanine527-N7)-methyltransferase